MEVDAQRTCLAWGWRWHVGVTFGSGFWRVRALREELQCDGAEGVDFDGLGVVVKEDVDAVDRGTEDVARVARVRCGGPAEGKIARLPQVEERCLGRLEEWLGGRVPGEVEQGRDAGEVGSGILRDLLQEVENGTVARGVGWR